MTPILINNFRKNLIDTINNSNLALCEIELIMKDIFAEVQTAARQEYEHVVKQLEEAKKAQGTEDTEKIEEEIIE